jgi:hypothetical protein
MLPGHSMHRRVPVPPAKSYAAQTTPDGNSMHQQGCKTTGHLPALQMLPQLPAPQLLLHATLHCWLLQSTLLLAARPQLLPRWRALLYVRVLASWVVRGLRAWLPAQLALLLLQAAPPGVSKPRRQRRGKEARLCACRTGPGTDWYAKGHLLSVIQHRTRPQALLL